MIKPKQVCELEFGKMMLLWSYKGTYPLEAVSTSIQQDDSKVLYRPMINDYATDEMLTAGDVDGYTSREQVMQCVGRCWDKAEAEVTKL